MDILALLIEFANACTSGKLGAAECGPLWQLALIAIFFLLAVILLVILQLRARARPDKA